MKVLKTNILLAGLVLSVVACQNQNPANNENVQSPTLMVNMTSDAFENAHSTLMGLHFAEQALKNEIQTTIFLNVDGVKLMKEGADTLSFDNENIHDLLSLVMKAGGKVLACPHCMEVHQVAEGDLVPGVTVATQDEMMQRIKDGPTVMTY